MSDLHNSWMAHPTFIAQSAHFFSAIAVILTAHHLCGKKPALIAAGIFTVCAFIKEFWYDLNYELPKQTVADGILDFCFYMIGIIFVSSLIYFIKPKQITETTHTS